MDNILICNNDLILMYKMFLTFEGLYDYISYVIWCKESNYNSPFASKEVVFDDLNSAEGLENFHFIVTDQSIFESVRDRLVNEYGIEKDKIILFRDWFLDKYKNDKNVSHVPKMVRLDISTCCQLNCKECYMRRDNYGTVGKGNMTFEQFKKFVDENPFLESIELSNSGEVFLNPDIKKMLEYAYKKNVAITILNGVNFNTVRDSVIEALVKYQVDGILFSIDGTTQEVYEQYRVNGNYDRVIKNIKKLNEYKKKYNSEFPYLRWQFIIFPQNVHQIEDVIKNAEELNMEVVFKKDWGGDFVPEDIEKVKRLTGLDYSSDKTDMVIVPNEEVSEVVVEEVKDEEIPVDDEIELCVTDEVDTKELGEKVEDGGFLTSEQVGTIYDNAGELLNYSFNDLCFQMLFEPQINWDGRLLGCCLTYQDDWGVNVFDVGFLNALNSEKFRQGICNLIGDLKDNDDNPCRFCAHYKDNILNKKFLNF